MQVILVVNKEVYYSMDAMDEEVKRLPILGDTLRQLYMLSGNRCAFPGCTHAMINEKGVFVGQICHIEAAMPGGERFNKNMTNEERRHISNLMLMCYDHHVETDDVLKYPVEKLKQMKKDHESLYMDIERQMSESINDYSQSKAPNKAKNGLKLKHVLSWKETEEEYIETMRVLLAALDNLKDVPIATRKLLGIMVMRAYKNCFGSYVIPIEEVMNATGERDLSVHIDTLSRRRIISDAEEDSDTRLVICKLYDVDGWDYWIDIRDFCDKTGIDIQVICTDLDFTVFDE